MYDILFEYYNVTYNSAASNRDTRPGAGITMKPSKILGTTVGSPRSMGDIYSKYDDVEDLDDKFEEDEETMLAIAKKVGNNTHQKAKDRKRHTVANTSGNMRFSGIVNEKRDEMSRGKATHTNPIRKGISPFKQKSFTKVDATSKNTKHASSPTGNFKKIGTQYGTSRAPIDYEFNDRLFFDEDPIDPMERSFLKQQKLIDKIKKHANKLQKE